jgi:hypothetical protein
MSCPVVCTYFNNCVGGNSAACVMTAPQTEIFRIIGSTIPT